MKPIYILIIQMIALSSSVFCQCPPAGLKIQTTVCDSPTNLRANTINCAKLYMSWLGNSNQSYDVEATYNDPATNNMVKEKAKNITCDGNGNCSATIVVKEGAIVDWNVQSICSINDITFYSNKTEGKQVFVPYCQSLTSAQKAQDINSESIRVFPNPTSGYLAIEYYSKVAGTSKFKIFDISGKLVFNTFNNVITGNNTYRLDISNLPPGNYVLEINTVIDTKRAKFVMIKP